MVLTQFVACGEGPKPPALAWMLLSPSEILYKVRVNIVVCYSGPLTGRTTDAAHPTCVELFNSAGGLQVRAQTCADSQCSQHTQILPVCVITSLHTMPSQRY